MTDRQTDARGNSISLTTLKGGDIIHDILTCGSCEILGNLHVYCMYTFCSMYQNFSEVTV